MPNPDKITLKPCPFCGGKAELYLEKYYGKEYWGISCLNENCFANQSDNEASYPIEENAIKAWNTRYPSSKEKYGQP